MEWLRSLPLQGLQIGVGVAIGVWLGILGWMLYGVVYLGRRKMVSLAEALRGTEAGVVRRQVNLNQEHVVLDIRRRTCRRFSAEEKIRIVLEGLRGEESITALCRREGLNPNLYYRWSKEFLEAGKKRLVGDTSREATSTEVTELRHENGRLKRVVAELVLENRLLKKGVTASDSGDYSADAFLPSGAPRVSRGRSDRCPARSTPHAPRGARSDGTGSRRFLERVHLNAAGIDIGSGSHWVAVPADRDERPVREFKSFTQALIELADWLTGLTLAPNNKSSGGKRLSSRTQPSANRAAKFDVSRPWPSGAATTRSPSVPIIVRHLPDH